MNLLPGEKFVPLYDHPQYLISNFGRVYSTKRQKFQAQFLSTRGFLQSNVDHKNVTIHISIARSFASKDAEGNYKKVYNVKFKDRNKHNTTLENLTWHETDL